jgi:hypothetical protein
LHDAARRNYFGSDEIQALIHLTFRAQKATTGLIKTLPEPRLCYRHSASALRG